MEELVNQIRSKYENIKFIIGEATPRKDDRDIEVKRYNELLKELESENEDVTIAIHQNLRDPKWSNHRDIKHIHESKIGKYAGNLITAIKKAYNITSKRDLFTSDEVSGTHWSNNEASSSSNAFTRQFTGTKEVTSEVFNRTPRDTWEAKGYRNYSMQDKLSRLANYDQKSWSAENGIDEISRLKQDLTKKLVGAIQNVLSWSMFGSLVSELPLTEGLYFHVKGTLSTSRCTYRLTGSRIKVTPPWRLLCSRSLVVLGMAASYKQFSQTRTQEIIHFVIRTELLYWSCGFTYLILNTCDLIFFLFVLCV